MGKKEWIGERCFENSSWWAASVELGSGSHNNLVLKVAVTSGDEVET